MSKGKLLAIVSISALVVLTLYQGAGESVEAQDASTWGNVLGVTFLVLGLSTWILAMLRAYSKKQTGWLVAMFLLWPAMYLYILWYDERS